jgi:hypothetical protein
MIVNFEQLHTNLLEIYSAAKHTPQGQSLSLAMTSDGTLYPPGNWVGRCLEAFNTVNRLLYPRAQPPAFHSVDAVMKHTLIDLFNRAVCLAYAARLNRQQYHIQELNAVSLGLDCTQASKDKQLQRHADRVTQELRSSNFISWVEELKVRKISEQELSEGRHCVIHFHEATHFIWPLFVLRPPHTSQHDLSVREILHPFVEKMIMPDQQAHLMNELFFKSLKKELHWVQMEGITQQMIPVARLAQIHRFDHLLLKDKQALKDWVDALNRHKQQLSVSALTSILIEIARLIDIQGSSPVKLEDILEWLDREGCLLIRQPDGIHMDWREGLQPGHTIECNGKQLVLGELLSPVKKNDAYKIFALKDFPRCVVKIACNRLLLLLDAKKAQSAEHHWGFRDVEIVPFVDNKGTSHQALVSGLDAKGRCVVFEKLSSPFPREWKSQTTQLDKAEEELALAFAVHIKHLMKTNTSVKNLSFDHLMQDATGCLKSTRLLKKGPSHYFQLERYCVEAAKGNFFVLSFIIRASQLHEHPLVHYSCRVVEKTVRSGTVSLVTEPLPQDHNYDYYKDHVRQLCQQALELHQECLNSVIERLRMNGQYSSESPEPVAKGVLEAFIRMYQAAPVLGCFLPDFVDRVMDNYFNSTSVA